MLVLSRRLNERIVIDGCIEVVVVEIGRERVKLGIRAPERISVYRREVYDIIQKENIASSRTGPDILDRVLELIGLPLRKTG